MLEIARAKNADDEWHIYVKPDLKKPFKVFVDEVCYLFLFDDNLEPKYDNTPADVVKLVRRERLRIILGEFDKSIVFHSLRKLTKDGFVGEEHLWGIK